MGGNSVIARLLGENKKTEVAKTLNFCVYAMIFAGLIILAAGLIFLEPVARIIGADTENFGYTCDYLKYIFAGAPFIMFSNGAVHLFRSVGLIKESTIGLALGNGINVIFDFIFIVILSGERLAPHLLLHLAFSVPLYIIYIVWSGKK